LLSCPALEGQGFFDANVKFGEAIDRDDRPTNWEKPAEESGVVWTTCEIDWDIRESAREIGPILQSLRSVDESIYRASIALGNASDAACRDVHRESCPADDRAPTLDSWSLALGPVDVCSLRRDRAAPVGWMELSLHGYGYLYPWTFRDLVERARESKEIAEAVAACSSLWPVSAAAPTKIERAARASLEELWPYDGTDIPLDWHWGLQEG